MRTLLLVAGLLLAAGPAAAAAPPAAFMGADEAVARKRMDALFDALAKAGSEEEAQPIEAQIVTLFLQSGSASVDLLMSRGAEALQGGDVGTARKLFASVTDIAPDYAEGWHQRGRIEAVAGDDEAAMVSLEKAVTLNPRQFQAYAELAGMLEDYGDKTAALAMYRKAQSLDPNLDDVARHVRELTRAVEGERI